MEKVPVGRSIAHAYEFLFGRFFQIIGTAWLPAVLYGAGYFVLLSNAQTWVNVSDPGSQARTAGIVLGFLLVATLVHAVIAISLTQEALGVRKDLTLAHLVVGPRELRLFFGFVRYYVLFAVLYALVLALCFGAVFAARKYGAGLAPKFALHGTPVAVLAAGAFAIILLVWFWLSMLRLLFLLAPVASVEHKLRLSRAWELTRGSTLRTFIVLVVVFLPVGIAAWAANRYMLAPVAMGSPPHGKPAEMLAHILQFYGANALPLAALSGVLAIVNGALLAGASAAAYRTVTHHEDPEPEDDVALVTPLLVPEAPQHADNDHDGHGQSVAVDGHVHDNHDGHNHDGHGGSDHAAHDEHGARDEPGALGEVQSDRDNADHVEEPASHDDPVAEDHGHSAHDAQGHGGQEIDALGDHAGSPGEVGHGEGGHGHDHGSHGEHAHGDHGHGDHGDGGHSDGGGHHAAMPVGGALDPVGIDATTEARAA
jgi:hypothetical protein